MKSAASLIRLTLGASLMALAACAPTTQDRIESASAGVEAVAPDAVMVDADAALAGLFDADDKATLAASPLSKAYRGVRDEDYGKWDDVSAEAEAREYARGQEVLATMQRDFADAKLSDSSRMSYRLYEYRQARAARAWPYRDYGYLFDQMNGAQSELPAFLINIHRIDNESDALAYIDRIRGIGPLLDALSAQSASRAAKGIMPPKWVYPFLLSDISNMTKTGSDAAMTGHPVIDDFREKLAKTSIADARKVELAAAAIAAWSGSAAPAYGRLRTEMERQAAMAPSDDGIWRFPDGAGYYASLLENYTTTKLSADEIHRIGLREVDRIHGQMRTIMAKVGFKGSLQDFFKELRENPKYYHSTREAYLADVDAKMKAMEGALPRYFNTLPKAPLTVKPVEAFREKSAGKAFYSRPAPDGSRPGTYYVNLYNLRDMSITELEALAYHEGIPGHHLQLAIQTELGDLPAFRRFGGVTAYSEGWGLYSEELGKDMGFYTDPYSDFGRLGMELWRACRLVVDTGLHDKRWSREQAIQYLVDNTPNPQGDIDKAIERYIVYPGQATAYMIGKLKIMELRSRAQDQLGNRFTMGDFHDVILKSGPVPLEIMEQNVDAWIKAGGGKN